MKNFLICSDKYKGCLTSNEVNQAIALGIKEADSFAICDLINMSDGGDGFLATIPNLTLLQFPATNALNQPIHATVGYKDNIIYIEVANVIGLAMLKQNNTSIWQRSSFGLGILIYNILDSNLNVNKIVIGCGGSASNDGGFSCLIGLGAQLLDKNNNPLQPLLSSIIKGVKFDLSTLHPKLKELTLEIIADVGGCFLGKNGSTQTFALQKGATNNDLIPLEQTLTYLQQLILKQTNIDLNSCSYGLCCGGLTTIFSLLPQTKYFSGANWVIQCTNLETKIATSDIIFSGEGKVDTTTLHGKLIWHIAQLCNKYKKPLIIIAGQIDYAQKLEELYTIGVTYLFSINGQKSTTNYDDSSKLISAKVQELLKTGVIPY